MRRAKRKIKHSLLDGSAPHTISDVRAFLEFGRLSSAVFHDIVNPLTTVLLTIEKLGEDVNAESQETKNSITTALKAGRLIKDLVSSINRQIVPQNEDIYFRADDEIHDVLGLLIYKAKTTNVVLCSKTTPISLYGSPIKFFRIVANLVSNAIDAYEHAVSTEKKQVLVTLVTNKENIVLSVEDFGCGIPQNIRDLIFNPFFTTKSTTKGIGIGLSSIKTLIEEDFKGTISFESIEGKGTVFTVFIPRKNKQETRRIRYMI